LFMRTTKSALFRQKEAILLGPRKDKGKRGKERTVRAIRGDRRGRGGTTGGEEKVRLALWNLAQQNGREFTMPNPSVEREKKGRSEANVSPREGKRGEEHGLEIAEYPREIFSLQAAENGAASSGGKRKRRGSMAKGRKGKGRLKGHTSEISVRFLGKCW